jgi:PAS domain S-box-containing protein
MIKSVPSSLRARLIALVLIAVVPAFALIAYTGIEQRNDGRQRAEQDARQFVELFAAEQGKFVEGARQLLSGLAFMPAVQDHDAATCAQLLAQINAEEARYTGLGVADANGDIFCTSLPSTSPINVADRAFFQRAVETGEFAAGEYAIGRASGKATLGMALPILGPGGNLQTLLIASLDLAWLQDLIVETDLPDGAALTVLDKQGVVLARYPELEGVVGETYPVADVLDTIQQEGTGTGEAKGIDGVDRLYSFAPLGDASEVSAYVTVGISTDTAFASANRTLVRNLAFLGIVALLALAAAWAAGDLFVVRSVRRLTAAAARLGAGDLSARASLGTSTGELGQLAVSFDDMATKLETRERERAQADRALRLSEERFRTLVEQLADGLVVVDERGSIEMVNLAAERMFGYTRDELHGQAVEVLLPEQLRPAHARHRGGYMKEPAPRTMGKGMDLHGRRKDGSEFPLAISLSPLEIEGGALVAAAFTDMTERKAAEDHLRMALDELTRSNSELEQFAYVASHDLQEPLRMVSNYTQLLGRRYGDKLDDAAREFIDYAVDGATRMQQLINDLLAFSRVGTRGREFTPTDGDAVLERTLVSLSPAIQEAGATVTHDPLPTVEADDVQLGQVFQNLIVNAIKFRNAAPPKVHVSAKRQGENWVFSVADNGIGIDPEYAERVFVIFQRLHGREEYPGTGIGLAVCKKVVERHGGRIWAEAAPGGGSVFSFTMPADRKRGQRAAA